MLLLQRLRLSLIIYWVVDAGVYSWYYFLSSTLPLTTSARSLLPPCPDDIDFPHSLSSSTIIDCTVHLIKDAIVYSCFWLSPTELWAFSELWPIPVCWYRTDLVMTTKCQLKLETWVYPVSLTCASFPWHKICISTMAHSYHLLGSCFNGIQRNWVNSVISNEIRSMFLDFWNNLLSIESKMIKFESC